MLLGHLADRWAHSVGVVRRAAELAGTVDPADKELLVVVAWLHDIGYSGALHDTWFHPLDGAGMQGQ
jgi:HD superfamily phosphodiesterase